MARRGKIIQAGERFTRADASTKVYEVIELVEKPGHAPHARLLLEEGTPTDVLLVSVSALQDRNLWRRVD
ncbi:hypothetical protein [Azospirillum sp. SYSU D00513]|uniref:hypothetical protein n=1 Tax=Azospirillum sp. SYSU D00513 TaxID=2812561 RepID=UPI001A979855|nr:hypothetical protein [Azospirillum sp. SYSU D00513]